MPVLQWSTDRGPEGHILAGSDWLKSGPGGRRVVAIKLADLGDLGMDLNCGVSNSHNWI